MRSRGVIEEAQMDFCKWGLKIGTLMENDEFGAG